MKHKFKYLVVLFVLCNGLAAQLTPNDSLKHLLKSATDDLQKIDLLNQLSEETKKSKPILSLDYSFEALQLAEEKKYTKGIADASNNLGNLYDRQSNYQKAFEYHSNALKLRQQLNDKKGIAASLNNIGSLYFQQRDFVKALEYYNKSLKIRTETADPQSVAASLNNIGGVYYSTKQYDKALDCYFQSLDIKNKIGDKTIGYNYNNIANMYADLGDLDKSLGYYFKALESAEGDKSVNTFAKASIASIYLDKGNLAESQKYAMEALGQAKETKDLETQAEVYNILSQINSKKGDYKKAYENFVQLQEVQDSISSNSSLEQMRESQFRTDIENKENSIALLKKDREIQKLQLSRNRTWIFILIFGLVLIVFGLTVLTSRYRVKKNANLLLLRKNKEIELQKKDITDSINYARLIQEAILPDKQIKYRAFPDAFVLFMPKDIVSGDFYWFTEKNGKRLIAAVDCTGHGVPGAFMSMIGNAFLNEIVNERGVTTPSEILDLLRSNIIKSLKQSAGESKDGMDIAILCFNEDGTINYAGANNPLWVFRKNKNTWTNFEIKADKQPIGFSGGTNVPFTNHRLQLDKGDSLYIFTDGFADQFGGPNGKKFKYKQLRDLLNDIQEKSMSEQESVLIKKFNEWKGSAEQVDDICVIGIRI